MRFGDTFYIFCTALFVFVCFKVSNVNFLFKLLINLWSEVLGKEVPFITLFQWKTAFQLPIKGQANKLLQAAHSQ
jgi:hypothetical protein